MAWLLPSPALPGFREDRAGSRMLMGRCSQWVASLMLHTYGLAEERKVSFSKYVKTNLLYPDVSEFSYLASL